jgi:hypothetical protein
VEFEVGENVGRIFGFLGVGSLREVVSLFLVLS